MKTKALIVEDEFIEANNLRLTLQKADYFVLPIANSVAAASRLIAKEQPDIVLLDIFLKGNQTGIDLAITLNEMNIPFVYLSANANKEILQLAKETRPYGFLVKPFRQKDILVTLDIAKYLHEYKTRPVALADELAETGTADSLNQILGSSTAMEQLKHQIKAVAPSDTSVLIQGETGTGKELVAKAIHQLSNRAKKPFVTVNCAALPASIIESELFGHEKGAFTGAIEKRKGRFELANYGTVFLDEIGELPIDMQIRFLRVLQEKEIEPVGGASRTVDVRIIAATNKDLEEEVAAGRFRLDLYYRLNVFPINVPPLRERRDDILPLAANFLQKFSKLNRRQIFGFSDEVRKSLYEYHWPGNVRELEHWVEKRVVLCNADIIDHADFNFKQNTSSMLQLFPGRHIKSIDEVEAEHIINVIRMCNGKLSGKDGAAELLGIPNSTLVSKIKKLGIPKSSYR